jgi:hypothetical protein
MSTLGTALVVGGLLVAGYVAYKLFFDPERFHHLGQNIRIAEHADPKAYGILKKAGIDIHKVEDTLDPKDKHSKANLGRFMSYY